MTENIKCKYERLVPIAELIPHPKNPNQHSGEQIVMLAKLIDYQGWRLPIIVSKRSGYIVSGHGRLGAAINLGLKEVPVSEQDFIDDAQEYAFLTSDNAIASWAELDLSQINTDLGDLGPDFDIDLLGIKDFVIELAEKLEPGCDENEVPEHVEPKTKLGDLYQLGSHRLLCGDSTSIDAVEKLMDGEKPDMVFTDPPYGINETGNRKNRNGKESLRQGVTYKDFIDDSTQYAIDAFNLCQGLKINLQIWWGANYYCHSIPQTNNWLIWDKRVDDKQIDFNSDAELAWVQNGKNSVRIFRHLWKGLIKGSEHGQARVHPTQKPIALAEWCFEKYDNPKAILDLFGGSGSTLIACEKTNRKCFMMELDPHYVDVIIARWEKFSGKKAVLLNGET